MSLLSLRFEDINNYGLLKVLDKLGSVYLGFIPDKVLNIVVPDEILATCSYCHNCVNPNNPKYHVKCCNYHPIQPNFIVGAMLSHKDSRYIPVQKIIRAKIHEKSGVGPMGIIPPSDFYINKEEAKCPYLKNQQCSIWEFRTELCSSFFCSSIGGRSGQKFWKSLLSYLKLVDSKLSLYILDKIGFEADITHRDFFDKSYASSKTKPIKIDNIAIRKHWKNWFGREEELYKECYKEILQLDANKLRDLLGWEGEWYAKLLIKKSKEFNDDVILDRLKILPITYSKAKVNSKELQIIETDKRVGCNEIQAMFLKMFDGKTSTKEIIRKSKVLNQDVTTLVYDLIQENLLIANYQKLETRKVD